MYKYMYIFKAYWESVTLKHCYTEKTMSFQNFSHWKRAILFEKEEVVYKWIKGRSLSESHHLLREIT